MALMLLSELGGISLIGDSLRGIIVRVETMDFIS